MGRKKEIYQYIWFFLGALQLLVEPISRLTNGSGADPGNRSGF